MEIHVVYKNEPMYTLCDIYYFTYINLIHYHPSYQKGFSERRYFSKLGYNILIMRRK